MNKVTQFLQKLVTGIISFFETFFIIATEVVFEEDDCDNEEDEQQQHVRWSTSMDPSTFRYTSLSKLLEIEGVEPDTIVYVGERHEAADAAKDLHILALELIEQYDLKGEAKELLHQVAFDMSGKLFNIPPVIDIVPYTVTVEDTIYL